jgi:eukaryotic-like serine/threonine-protein kinase
MSQDEISKLESLFHELAGIPPGAERDRAALRLSGGDEVLAHLAAGLVDSKEKAEAANHAARQAVSAPRLYGHYRTIRLLGSGGMGTVYLAERADGQFQQTTAIKVIAPYFAGAAFRERFLAERQILAALSHPNITRLLDGGVTDDGTPYLVMEYVAGEPLDSYCDAHKLGLRARLELFLKVCAPVAYAHRNLVVHRDLKPSNIMVTADGEPMLLDFGTSKVLSGAETIAAPTLPLMTIRYSSPEQRSQAPATTSTDIFSLGVILYELLTGAWPFGDPASPQQALECFARETPMSSPAAAVSEQASLVRSSSLRSLKNSLAGDLTNVLGKALDPAPERRYETVQALAADIENWLAGLPVQARPARFSYRAGKFLRRNWLAMTGVAILVAGLSVAAVLVILQSRVARQEAARAQAEARRSVAVNEFLNDMLSSASSGKFDPLKYTVAQMVDDAAAKVGDRWKSDASTEGAVRLSLGESYTRLNRRDEALVQLTRAVQLIRSTGDDQQLAGAMYAMADFWADGGNHDEAIADLREALTLLNRLGRRADQEQVFWVKNYLSWHLSWMRRDLDEARTLIQQAIEVGKKEPRISKGALSEAETHQGDLLMIQGKVAEARSIYEEALRLGRQDDPGGYWERVPLHALVSVEAASGNFSAAADYARQSYELYRKYSGDENPYTAQAKIRWARYRTEAGAPTEETTRDVLDAMAVERRGFPEGADGFLQPYGNAARVFNLAKRYREAESYARAALVIIDQNRYSPGDERRAPLFRQLGEALSGQQRYQEAIMAFEQAEGIYRQHSTPSAVVGLQQVQTKLNELRSQTKK